MSETSGGASYATGEYNIPGSMGIPMIDTIYSVVDPLTKEPLKFTDGVDLLTGEFIISSPAIVDAKIDGRTVVEHGEYNGQDFIYTKDIGTMDRNGVLNFLSRDDRGFTRFDGFKVKPYEIEKEIKKVAFVKDCIISPYDDSEKFGKMIKADIRADIRDRQKMKDIFAEYQPEIVFHLAAQPLVRLSYEIPAETYETNVMGSINIMEAASTTDSVKVIVMITTDKCYENREQIWGYRENEH